MNYDVIIVGGSFAGLSAALYLARARKQVCVLDLGDPRNRFASHSHGFFAHDGVHPAVLLETMRKQIAAYPTATLLSEAAVDAAEKDGSISVTMWCGDIISGKRLLLAFGISDILPETPGLAERWGASVVHCPYCHGYEFSGKKLGVLNVSAISHHQAMLVSEWGPTTFYLDGAELDAPLRAGLAERGIGIETGAVRRLAGKGRELSRIYLSENKVQPLDALFISPRYHLNSPIAEQFGCLIENGPLGQTIKVDQLQMTSVPNIYAAGDISRTAHNITFACADGVMAAMAIHNSLVFEELK